MRARSILILSNPRWITPIFAFVALVSRAQFLGNPILDSDEGFYLLVGERMLRGALPYIDIWDRKPLGLFLLYAGMRSLGGDGVLAYQLIGTAFACATAIVISRIARQFSSGMGPIAAGIAYLIWLTLGSAAGGQAEIFFALPVCSAAWLTLRALQEERPARIVPRGALAMLLVGVAAQVKYTALFEGIFFGCCWMRVSWRNTSQAALPINVVIWISAAIFPTALALSYYAAIGHVDAFIFANFVSIAHRGSTGTLVLLGRLAIMGIILVPLLAWVRPRASMVDRAAITAFRFVLSWLLAAIGGVLLFGTYFEHYLLPILVPASAAAAPTFQRLSKRRVASFLTAFFVLGQVDLWVTQQAHGSRAELATVLRHINGNGCLYVYSGLAALYRISGSCMVTRFAFPSHLSRMRESRAIGKDPVQEVARIMGLRPSTVIVRSPYQGDENWAARTELYRHLTLGYRMVFRGKLGWQTVQVYRTVTSKEPLRELHDRR